MWADEDKAGCIDSSPVPWIPIYTKLCIVIEQSQHSVFLKSKTSITEIKKYLSLGPICHQHGSSVQFDDLVRKPSIFCNNEVAIKLPPEALDINSSVLLFNLLSTMTAT